MTHIPRVRHSLGFFDSGVNFEVFIEERGDEASKILKFFHEVYFLVAG